MFYHLLSFSVYFINITLLLLSAVISLWCSFLNCSSSSDSVSYLSLILLNFMQLSIIWNTCWMVLASQSQHELSFTLDLSRYSPKPQCPVNIWVLLEYTWIFYVFSDFDEHLQRTFLLRLLFRCRASSLQFLLCWLDGHNFDCDTSKTFTNTWQFIFNTVYCTKSFDDNKCAHVDVSCKKISATCRLYINSYLIYFFTSCSLL